jgi:hypothetical protein
MAGEDSLNSKEENNYPTVSTKEKLQNEIQHINISLDMMKDIMGEQLGNIMTLVSDMSTEDILAEQAKHSLWIMAINDELNKRMSGV